MSVQHQQDVRGGHVWPRDSTRLYAFRQASLHGDRSQIPAMVAALSQPTHRAYEFALPRMLARLGAAQAIPVLDAYISDGADTRIGVIARVAKARLLAEMSCQGPGDVNAQAATKTRTFLQGLGLTPAGINAALQERQGPDFDRFGRHVLKMRGKAPTVGVQAAGELADMTYHGSSEAYLSLPQVSGIDFGLYYLAALKMRLAPLSRQQRIDAMVSDLSGKSVLRADYVYEVQLLSDEGDAALEAVSQKLRQDMSDRSNAPSAGMGALLYVLAGAGGAEQLPLVEELEKDGNATVANCAVQAGLSLRQGGKRIAVFSY